MYAVGFHFDRYKCTIGSNPVLQDYSWWIALVGIIAPQADKFEIRCCSDEPEAMAMGQRRLAMFLAPKSPLWYNKYNKLYK